MARDLHIAPWVIENECTQGWWRRYWAVIQALNKAAKSGLTQKVE